MCTAASSGTPRDPSPPARVLPPTPCHRHTRRHAKRQPSSGYAEPACSAEIKVVNQLAALPSYAHHPEGIPHDEGKWRQHRRELIYRQVKRQAEPPSEQSAVALPLRRHLGEPLTTGRPLPADAIAFTRLASDISEQVRHFT